jgi:hypothetical protein
MAVSKLNAVGQHFHSENTKTDKKDSVTIHLAFQCTNYKSQMF